MNWKNRSYCGQISNQLTHQEIQVYGWVDTIRDHGQVLFIHLRDVSGVVQVVFDPLIDQSSYAISQTLKPEYVISIQGKVRDRSEETKNPQLTNGDIEIIASKLEILNTAETPPFSISEKEGASQTVDEEVRLTYRYLDLRRPLMQQNMINRFKILNLFREYLTARNFIEVETPTLTKSTPEGARDYLVPSRIHPDHFYALPQSPQLFKQLLMIAGMDRYFQVAKCFRDEDLRPNRQPEFTQLDLEASFIDESFIYELIEGIIPKVFAIQGIAMTTPFPHMTYTDAMNRFGSDAPDLRFGLEMIDVTDVFANTNYKIFRGVLDAKGIIKGFNISGKADVLTKNLLQNEWALEVIPKLGGKGMTWMKMTEEGLQSNIVQFFSEAEQHQLIERMNAKIGDVLIFVADPSARKVNDLLGRFRLFVAESLQLIPENTWNAVWITDFPLFEKKQGKIESVHHPFTQAQQDLLALQSEAEILSVKARAYDLVINGQEVGGGSIRNHDVKVQKRMFEILGLNDEQIKEKFGFFIEAFQYGAPPHGGLALGIDRLVSMILNTPSIREVIAFPKNRVATCPMSQAPSPVELEQLQDLHLKVIKNLS